MTGSPEWSLHEPARVWRRPPAPKLAVDGGLSEDGLSLRGDVNGRTVRGAARRLAGRLGKPFDDVSKIMRERVPGFTKTITPKSMRRTNKDLLRNEGVSQLVAQAISSHHDPKMHAHYSTISDAEKASALAKVIRLFPSRLPACNTGDDRGKRPRFDRCNDALITNSLTGVGARGR
jgi:hypothetical protein